MEEESHVVLLVEDDPDHAEIILRGFEENRVINRIRHVIDGQAALDYVFHHGAYSDPAKNPEPQLVLLDLRLPKMDGLEVLKRIKEDPRTRQIPVVVLTTSDADRDITAAYDRHVNSYLVKPLDFQKFSDLMRQIGCYWLRWNCPPWR